MLVLCSCACKHVAALSAPLKRSQPTGTLLPSTRSLCATASLLIPSRTFWTKSSRLRRNEVLEGGASCRKRLLKLRVKTLLIVRVRVRPRIAFSRQKRTRRRAQNRTSRAACGRANGSTPTATAATTWFTSSASSTSCACASSCSPAYSCLVSKRTRRPKAHRAARCNITQLLRSMLPQTLSTPPTARAPISMALGLWWQAQQVVWNEI